MSSEHHAVTGRTTVVFAYDEAKGCFVDVPGWKPGGAPLAIYTLATELAKDEAFDVRLLVAGDVPSQPVEGVRLVSRIAPIQRGIPVLSRVMNRARLRAPFKGMSRFVVLATVALYDYLPVYQELVQSLGGKIVYRIASDLDVKPEQRGSDGTDPFTIALAKCDGLIAQTTAQAHEVKARLGREAEVISPSFRIPPDRPVAKKDIILWVGQSYPIKRPWVFLELARAFPSEKFVMILPNVERGLWEAIAASAAHLSNLELVETVPLADIQTYFDCAKVFVNTSTIEGFPNTFHQAAIGRAPVLSLSWNPDGYLDEHGIGMCAEGDTRVLIEQLAVLLGDSELRHNMGSAARRRVEKFNNVSIAIEEYKRVFRSLTGG